MKILHVTQCLQGGVPDAIETLVRAAPSHHHSVVWPAANDAGRSHSFTRVHHAPMSHIAFIRALGPLVRAERPDVIHAHSSWAGIYTRIQRLGVPIVYQPHCYAFESPRRSRAARLVIRSIERLLAPRAIVTIVLTPHEETLAVRLARGRAVTQVRNVSRVSTEVTWEPSTESATVVMVGRVTDQKDPDFFAAVAESVRLTRPDARFVWIGSGEDELTARLERAGVEVTGWVSHREVQRMLAEAFLYLHTASYEGFPLTVLDAAAIGCPMLLRAIPAFEGMGLSLVRSSSEAAKRIEKLLGDGDVDRLLSASAKLTARSTLVGMGEALNGAYAKAAKR